MHITLGQKILSTSLTITISKFQSETHTHILTMIINYLAEARLLFAITWLIN